MMVFQPTGVVPYTLSELPTTTLWSRSSREYSDSLRLISVGGILTTDYSGASNSHGVAYDHFCGRGVCIQATVAISGLFFLMVGPTSTATMR